MTENNTSIKTAETAPVTQDDQPEHPKKKSIRERIVSIPRDFDNAVEEGKTNTVIEGVQNIVYSVLSAAFESCRLASLKLFMLTKEQRKCISKQLYIFSFIAAGGICIDLFFNFQIKTILLSVAFLISAYLADIVVQTAVLKTRKQTLASEKEQKSKPINKLKHKGLSTDDDIL